MKTKHTKGSLSIISSNYDEAPKEIITGIGVSEILKYGIYTNVLFNTILPDNDEDYIEQHDQIKADCEHITKCWNMHDEILIELNNSNKILETLLTTIKEKSPAAITIEKQICWNRFIIEKATE